ncbi:hypothetical protein D3C73_1459880 [compost metagenome]
MVESILHGIDLRLIGTNSSRTKSRFVNTIFFYNINKELNVLEQNKLKRYCNKDTIFISDDSYLLYNSQFYKQNNDTNKYLLCNTKSYIELDV